MKRSDTHALDALLHNDLVFNIPTGQRITKAMDIANYSSGLMQVQDISTADLEVMFVSDLAVVTVTAHLKGTYARHNIDGKFRYLRVWKLFGSSWKVVAGSGIALQEA
jgi:ketosteroid isomerase-like protein